MRIEERKNENKQISALINMQRKLNNVNRHTKFYADQETVAVNYIVVKQDTIFQGERGPSKVMLESTFGCFRKRFNENEQYSKFVSHLQFSRCRLNWAWWRFLLSGRSGAYLLLAFIELAYPFNGYKMFAIRSFPLGLVVCSWVTI